MKIKDIQNIFEYKSISPKIILKDIIKIISKKSQKFSIIREIKNIEKLKIIFDDSINLNFINIYSESSSLLQNIISNIIRKNF